MELLQNGISNWCKTVWMYFVNIAKSGDKRALYDIANIKRIIQNYSTSDKPFSVLSNDSNNRIAQNTNPVKENIKNVLSKVKLGSCTVRRVEKSNLNTSHVTVKHF